MVIRAEAQSLDSLTSLADDPPLHIRRYPPQPPSQGLSAHQLKLYIVRVPNSQDIILTPLKPQSNSVTAQDVVSCLYYLRVQPIDPAAAAAAGANKPRSQSLQADHASNRYGENNRPGYPARASFSGESTGSGGGGGHLHPASGNFLAPSTASLTSVGSGGSLGPNGNDFEITFIRRDRTSGSQATIGRIYSSQGGLSDLAVSNSFAAAMMAQEASQTRQGRRDRKRMNLEIWTEGYHKFLYKKPAHTPTTPFPTSPNPTAAFARKKVPGMAPTMPSQDSDSRPSPVDSYDDSPREVTPPGGYKDLLWPAPVPPPAHGYEDFGPPPPPKHGVPQQGGLMPTNPAITRLSRFTEVYSPDTPTPHPRLMPNSATTTPSTEMIMEDDMFRRTLNLEGEGFWKSTGKRFSAFSNNHRRVKSQPDTAAAQYGVSEETRIAMERMGLHTPPQGSGSPASSFGGAVSPGLEVAQVGKETKGKGYVFEPPVKGSGRCEFETNSVGRKIRLKLHPPSTLAGSPFGNAVVVKSEPMLLSTLSFQPPEYSNTTSGAGRDRSESPNRLGGGSGRSSRFKFGEKFKAKLNRQGSWTEHFEQEAGSGMRSKLGSLLVEGEGIDMLDLVVVSNMGVFWKKYCDWSADLKNGGI